MNRVKGQYVKKYESGNRGCTTIGQCGNDGGASFGTYQLVMSWGNVFAFLKKYFYPEYKSAELYFNLDQMGDVKPTWYGEKCCTDPETVKKVWLNCVRKAGKKQFEEYEHQYIQGNYYEVTRWHFKKHFNVDTDLLSIAWQESIWACSVRDGSQTAYDIFKTAVGKAQFTQTAFDKYYDAREARHYDAGRYKKGSPASERENLRIFLDDYIPLATVIKKTSKKPLIMWLQYKLGGLEIDGKYGKLTAQAVEKYWSKLGWKVTSGYAVGIKTIQSLI